MAKLNLSIIASLIMVAVTATGQKSNEPGNDLEILGNIQAKGKSNFEMANCIANDAMIFGVTSYTESDNKATESSFVEGNYSYTYFVNDYESEAGLISFKFSYKIKEEIVAYKFYDFQHDGTGTKFQSIGQLPKEWNSDVGKIFNEIQYNEIMKDLFANCANSIRMISKSCLK